MVTHNYALAIIVGKAKESSRENAFPMLLIGDSRNSPAAYPAGNGGPHEGEKKCGAER